MTMIYSSFFTDKTTLTNDARILDKYGMRSAALFYLNKNEPLIRRAARVTRCYSEETYLPAYSDTSLYPYGGWSPSMINDDQEGHGLRIGYTGGYIYNSTNFASFTNSLSDPFEKTILQRIATDMQVFTAHPMSSRYRHGGGHWVMDHAGVLSAGLSGYRAKILDALNKEKNEEIADILEQCIMLDLQRSDNFEVFYNKF